MRILLVAVLVLAACTKKDGPQKLKKMDFKVAVDDRGRMLPQIELFDEKHKPIIVEGSYTLTLARPDGTILCSHTRTLAKTDYSKGLLKSDWLDSTCPPDPAAEELRITLEVKTGDKPDAPKLSREKTTPTKFIYRSKSAPPPPPVGSGSVTPEAPAPAPDTGGSGSATKPAAAGSAVLEAEATGSATGSGSAK